MDPSPNPSSSSQIDKHWMCSCRKYCNEEPRLLPERTFYRHLSEARGEEQLKIVALKAMSLDAACDVLAHRKLVSQSQPDPNQQAKAGPSTGLLLARSIHRAETE
jgi:hypothetical protein